MPQELHRKWHIVPLMLVDQTRMSLVPLLSSSQMPVGMRKTMHPALSTTDNAPITLDSYGSCCYRLAESYAPNAVASTSNSSSNTNSCYHCARNAVASTSNCIPSTNSCLILLELHGSLTPPPQRHTVFGAPSHRSYLHGLRKTQVRHKSSSPSSKSSSTPSNG